VSSGPEARDAGGAALIDRLRADPSRAAVLTDIDGTLAPIVQRPEEAAVPSRASDLLRRLAETVAVVGCVSGRQAGEARRLVGVPEIAYAGNHGLELLLPGESSARLDPTLGERAGAAGRFVAGLDPARLAAAGLRLEDKGPIQALHWRGAASEQSAEELAKEIAAEAADDGLAPHWGRKVLELRPRGGAGKDAAVGALLASTEVAAALYAGDDRTDLDAFRRLREMREGGELELAVCVGITSPEGPAELAGQSDITVEGPDGWLSLLERLAS
jgi:trehalose 6-phosphate phosphatase